MGNFCLLFAYCQLPAAGDLPIACRRQICLLLVAGEFAYCGGCQIFWKKLKTNSDLKIGMVLFTKEINGFDNSILIKFIVEIDEPQHLQVQNGPQKS
jgi:hypothetical protein